MRVRARVGPSPPPCRPAGWGLTEDPAGALGTCREADPVVPSVQRDVLVAEVDGSAGVWVSSFETP